MNWLADGKYCLRSECGKYRITKTSHTSGDWQYASIFQKQIIGSGFSAEHEKARCADHDKGQAMSEQACANHGRKGVGR